MAIFFCTNEHTIADLLNSSIRRHDDYLVVTPAAARYFGQQSIDKDIQAYIIGSESLSNQLPQPISPATLIELTETEPQFIYWP